MKKKAIYFIITMFIAFIILFNNLTLAQFKITNDATDKYSIDPFTNEIYYTEFYKGNEKKITLPDLLISDSPFSGLPHFSKVYHRAAYFDLKGTSAKIYLHDFVKDSTYLLYDFANSNNTSNKLSKTEDDGNPTGLKFSPNDVNLLVNDFPDRYYSFLDRSMHSLGTEISYANVWSSDSTIMFGHNSEYIFEMNIYTLKIDTVLSLSQYNNISSFEYNAISQIIAYGVEYDSLNLFNPQLHLFNKETGVDSIIFSINNTDCAGSPVAITWIKWDTEANKIAFFIYDGTAPLTGISFYDLDSSKTFEVTECKHYPLKELLSWYSKDTLIYLHFDYEYWNAYQLYGIPIKKITSVRDDILETSDFYLYGNYPNPFNPITTISYKLPRISDVELKIYDILGHEVKSFVISSQSAGTQNIVWDGTNNYNEHVSSGIYIYRFKAISREGKNEVFVKSAKLIMLK